ncbi:hypothetical protein SAMN05661080_05029 [Modestobacter sp. DSM 44400]|uniref:hypothetical protein n=1 Tax=Modestobacter sp. DSM 44400 TaxID=1550230 RepID=UPI00089B4BCE|nr:hypothetical protein [Modestobacter sp. DSM 44400]SDY92206.1 hypothetical protein SAMN05661080_05029 [Modestobacter sp. DSM 44400]
MRAFTRWVDEASKQLPRELVIEVRGRTGSLDEAAGKFGAIARPLTTLAGFVANVLVGTAEVHLAYDSTPTREEREFLETFLPDERGAVSDGRIIQRHLLEAVAQAFVSLSTDSDRVSRALRQYEMALRYWYVGGEWLALSHLWMAVEALTDAVIKKEAVRRGVGNAGLAKSFGLPLDDPDKPWGTALRHETRRRVIFRSDDEIYQAARKGRNGLEHGFMELDKVAAHALKSADKTFHHVRQTIIDLLGLAPEIASELMEIKPKDVQSSRKVARGRLIGAAVDPAMEGELYPRLAWSSGIDAVVREGSTFQMKSKDRMTIRTHPNVGFRLEQLEVHSRVEDGQSPVQLSDEGVDIEHAPARPSDGLLERVMALVDSSVANGSESEHTPASMFAFNMFGQGVAFFQSAQALISAYLPVEALTVVRGLTIVAARFEAMADPEGPGLGVALRAVMDTIASSGSDPDLIATRLAEFEAGAKAAGLTVPSELLASEETDIFRSLQAEMNMASDLLEANYVGIELHVMRIDEEHTGFQTKLEGGPLTDLVASAATIAMLDTLRNAALVFEWTIEADAIEATMARAREVNEAAALLDFRPTQRLPIA